MAAPNTHLPYWTSSAKGQLKFGGETFHSFIISGPKREVFTMLVLDGDRQLVEKVLAALAKSEA